jgi:hypothetical protein
MKSLAKMILTVVISAASCLAALAADTSGDSAKVDVTCLVPQAAATFTGTLELRLYKIHPMIADKAADLVEKVEVKGFSHTEGTETTKELVIGSQAKLDPAMKYYITCFVLDAKDKRTHMGESGKQGPSNVLTQGNPKQVSLKIRKL